MRAANPPRISTIMSWRASSRFHTRRDSSSLFCRSLATRSTRASRRCCAASRSVRSSNSPSTGPRGAGIGGRPCGALATG
ncbi:unnamed protein product [Linum trigynum]|uniref:Uncharacterized protein n=1 Tax=Linum trigynum TaxID=586398 RepID=A0AAV2ES91_9ROSI